MTAGREDDGPNRIAILAASMAITAGVAYLAFLLGAWGFDTRRFSQHERRLQKVLLAKPVMDRVVRGLEDEGSPLIASARGAAELERVARQYAPERAAAVAEKGAGAAQTRVFRAGDMIYFIFFDEGGVMSGYTIASR